MASKFFFVRVELAEVLWASFFINLRKVCVDKCFHDSINVLILSVLRSSYDVLHCKDSIAGL